MRHTVIELSKEAMKFSAGHFTIFSATERERLHGHNFTVYVALHGPVSDNGLFADYGPFKKVVIDLCREWNEYFLLPGNSPHLKIRHEDDYLYADFGNESIPFLPSDVLVLPLRNTTLEEMSELFCARFVERCGKSLAGAVNRIVVKIASGPGQWASYDWPAEQAGS